MPRRFLSALIILCKVELKFATDLVFTFRTQRTFFAEAKERNDRCFLKKKRNLHSISFVGFMTAEKVTFEVLPRCGLAYRTEPSYDAKESSGRFAKYSEVVEAVSVDDDGFIRLRDGSYLPLR